MNQYNFAVLGYHSLGYGPLSVRPEIFRYHISYLYRKGFKCVSIKDLFVSNKDNQKKVIGVSFDDCFLDNIKYALPILKEFKAKATFFAATSYDDQIMWGSKKKNNWSKEKTKYHTIPFSFMGKKERLILRDEDMEVGSHTCNHPNLDKLSRDEQFNEISKNKILLTNELNQEINSFAFPRGRFNENTLSILKQLKFKYALTTKFGYFNYNFYNKNPYSLPRIFLPNYKSIVKNVIYFDNLKFSLKDSLNIKINNIFR